MLTVKELIGMLEQQQQDLPIMSKLHELQGIEKVTLSDRHSKDWHVPKEYIELKIDN